MTAAIDLIHELQERGYEVMADHPDTAVETDDERLYATMHEELYPEEERWYAVRLNDEELCVVTCQSEQIAIATIYDWAIDDED